MTSIARDTNVDERIGICEKSRVDLKILISAHSIFTIRPVTRYKNDNLIVSRQKS